jgi:hypothetical protein
LRIYLRFRGENPFIYGNTDVGFQVVEKCVVVVMDGVVMGGSSVCAVR